VKAGPDTHVKLQKKKKMNDSLINDSLFKSLHTTLPSRRKYTHY
jgi:hypothetical protein